MKDGILSLVEIIQFLNSGKMRRFDFRIQHLDGKNYDVVAYTIKNVTTTIRIDIKEAKNGITQKSET